MTIPNVTGGAAGPATSGSQQSGSINVGGLNAPAYPFASAGFALPAGLPVWLLGGSVLALLVALLFGRKKRRRK